MLKAYDRRIKCLGANLGSLGWLDTERFLPLISLPPGGLNVQTAIRFPNKEDAVHKKHFDPSLKTVHKGLHHFDCVFVVVCKKPGAAVFPLGLGL